MKKIEITDKDLFFLGLMYSRGNFIGEREKVVVIYFRANETELMDRIKNIHKDFLYQKSVKIEGNKSILGLYFPSSRGEKVKESFRIGRQTIRARELPKSMEHEKALDPNFIRGLLTFGIEIKNTGFLFWKKKNIIIKEQSIIILKKMGSFLLKNGVPFEIEDKSSQCYYIGTKKVPMPSILTIKTNHLQKFYNVLLPINPELDFLKASS